MQDDINKATIFRVVKSSDANTLRLCLQEEGVADIYGMRDAKDYSPLMYAAYTENAEIQNLLVGKIIEQAAAENTIHVSVLTSITGDEFLRNFSIACYSPRDPNVEDAREKVKNALVGEAVIMIERRPLAVTHSVAKEISSIQAQQEKKNKRESYFEMLNDFRQQEMQRFSEQMAEHEVSKLSDLLSGSIKETLDSAEEGMIVDAIEAMPDTKEYNDRVKDMLQDFKQSIKIDWNQHKRLSKCFKEHGVEIATLKELPAEKLQPKDPPHFSRDASAVASGRGKVDRPDGPVGGGMPSK